MESALHKNYTTWATTQNPPPDGQPFPQPPQVFWLFSLQETCSGFSRGEATISQSFPIASAVKCNWLKGGYHRVKQKKKQKKRKRKNCVKTVSWKEAQTFIWFVLAARRQRDMCSGSMSFDSTAKRTTEATKLNGDWPKSCQTRHAEMWHKESPPPSPREALTRKYHLMKESRLFSHVDASEWFLLLREFLFIYSF